MRRREGMDLRLGVPALLALVIGWHCCVCFAGAQAPSTDVLFHRINYRSTAGICDAFVRPQGYACEELRVQTVDGFVLGVQRMSTTTTGDLEVEAEAKKPVFLYHGVLSGGDSWLLNEERDDSLPFLLADAGYEVWIGNTRTTDFSYGHITASRKDEIFWDWSTDELVANDLPSMLQLVHSSTNQTAHLVGFSQGTQVGVAGLAEGNILPMVDRVVLLAPVVRLDTITSVLGVAASLFLVDQVMLLAHAWEFNINLPTGQKLLDAICVNVNTRCDSDFISLLTGPNCCFNSSRRLYYEQYETQSTASKNLAHFAQQFRTKSFVKYDYGFWGNLVRYHALTPPEYDLSKIPPEVPLLLVHGGRDGLSDRQDVELLLRSLSFSPQVIYVPDYGHLDFLLSSKANIDVYSKVLDFLAAPGA